MNNATGNIGLRIRAEGLETQGYNEAGNLDTSVMIVGVSNLSSQTQSLKVNGSETLNAGQLAATTGLILTIFNTDFTVNFSATYDTSLPATLTNFVSKLQSITDTQPFAILSVGSFESNTIMDNQIKSMGSVEWRNYLTFYNVNDYRYAAFGLGALGITTERHFFDSALEPDAEINALQNTSNDIGNTGFGTAIDEWIDPDNIIKIHNINPVIGQHIIVSTVGMINRSDFIGASECQVIWQFLDAGDTVLGSDFIVLGSCEILEKKDKYSLIPTGTTKLKIWRTLPTADVKFISVYFAGFSTPNTGIKMSNFGLSTPSMSLSPVSASPYIPETWKKLHRSNSNAYAVLDMPQDQVTSVQWGYDTLTNNTNKTYITTIGDLQQIMDTVSVEHDQLYYCSIWVYCIDKTVGNIYFGLYSDSDLLNADDGLINGNAYFQSPDISQIGTGHWSLLQGWLLPSTWTRQEVIDFQAKNIHFFGYKSELIPLDPNNGGIGNHHLGNTGGMVQMTSLCTNISLRFLDYGNAGATSSSMWALPVMSKVNSASWDSDNSYTLDINPV